MILLLLLVRREETSAYPSEGPTTDQSMQTTNGVIYGELSER